jgi:hypothetical protein
LAGKAVEGSGPRLVDVAMLGMVKGIVPRPETVIGMVVIVTERESMQMLDSNHAFQTYESN